MKLIIYGAGGESRVILRLASEVNASRCRWDEIIFADDVASEQELSGCRILSFDRIVKEFNSKDVEFVISLGEPAHRRMLFEKVTRMGYSLCAPIDLNEENAKYNNLGRGVVLTYKAQICNNNTVADNTIVEGAIVTHDVTIGKHSFICAGVVIGGWSTIGDGTFIGLNSTIRDRISIGSNVIVGMGACVTKDIPDYATAIGNPAHIISITEGRKVFS